MRIEPTGKQTAVLQHSRQPWITMQSVCSCRPLLWATRWWLTPGNASMLLKPEWGVWTLHEDVSLRSRERGKHLAVRCSPTPICEGSASNMIQVTTKWRETKDGQADSKVFCISQQQQRFTLYVYLTNILTNLAKTVLLFLNNCMLFDTTLVPNRKKDTKTFQTKIALPSPTHCRKSRIIKVINRILCFCILFTLFSLYILKFLRK